MSPQEMTKKTISVPVDLQKRMAKLKDVNWSEVACKAFETKLSSLKESKSMSKGIERLRASKAASQSERHDDGVANGKQWALDSAEYSQVERLAEAKESMSWMDWNRCLESVEGDAFGPSHFVARVIGGEGLDRQDCRDFWEQAIGDDVDRMFNDEFVQGFVEGALDVWETLESE